MTAVDFWGAIDEDLQDLAKQLRPIKAYIGTENSEGRVSLRFPGQDQPTEQRYPKLAGPRLDAGAPVYVLRRGDKHLVLGAISDGTWASGGLNIIGSLPHPDLLPRPGGERGDAYLVTGELWVWDGNDWVNAGSIQGPVGPEGPRGPQGIQGPEGPGGPVGPEGPEGPRGERGDTGPRGIQGMQGPEGPKGERGYPGEQGIQGPQGDKGETGDTGPQGDQGSKGDHGIPGIQGEPGPQGDKGDRGDPGVGLNIIGPLPSESHLPPTGNEGDAYVMEDTGDLWMWLDGDWRNIGNVQGPQGPPGETGPEGPEGPPGPEGPRGLTGAEGQQGPPGETGPDGPPGDDGADGAQGPPGEAATISVGTTTTGDEGAVASVTQRGTSQDRIFDFVVPRGQRGLQGIQGIQGIQGDKGDPGNDGTPGAPGILGITRDLVQTPAYGFLPTALTHIHTGSLSGFVPGGIYNYRITGEWSIRNTAAGAGFVEGGITLPGIPAIVSEMVQVQSGARPFSATLQGTFVATAATQQFQVWARRTTDGNTVDFRAGRVWIDAIRTG